MRDRKYWFWAGILLYALACRLMPWALSHQDPGVLEPATTWYPWNFAPMLAVCLFCGAGVQQSRWSVMLPLAVQAAGDFGIFALTGNRDWAFPPGHFLVYLSYVIVVGLGTLVRVRPQWTTAFPAALGGEVVFFLVSNFGVWWFGEGTGGVHYPFTFAGLMACYVAALPFAGRSLVSTLLFTGLLFSPASLRMAGLAPVNERRENVAVAP
jgi:hypothetical protein